MKDQLNRPVHLDKIPKRIISIVPSQTELLCDLGLSNEVVGITKFCIHPDSWFTNKKRVGGTKKINMEIVKELQPDLIFANKEENTLQDIEQLEKICPVWISDINTFASALDMILSIGKIVGKEEKANQIVSDILSAHSAFAKRKAAKITALYIIWKNPYMAAGGSTFIHEMLAIAGFQNVLQAERYPEVSIEEILKLNPEYLFLSSEPFPFKQKDIDELQLQLPYTKIILVDGEMFSWYGSRMLKSFDYFSTLHESIQ